MILSRKEMLDAEASAFSRGMEAADLMESAGRQMAGMASQIHPVPGVCRVFAGKGHNGGDVLVAARYLAALGWEIAVENIFPESELAPLTCAQLSKLPSRSGQALPFRRPLLVLDGLLGIGASGPPREPVAAAIHRINLLRTRSAAWVLSADVPSGLDADTGLPANPCVVADATMAMGFMKSGLVADSATAFVGRLAVARLPALIPSPTAGDPASVSCPEDLRPTIPPRGFDTHKGLCGRVAVIAGSSGYTGAARLCSEAAVFGGAGLVTLFVPQEIYPILAASAIPEVMVRPSDSLAEVLDSRWDAIAIGPGLGRSRDNEVVKIVKEAPCPCVVDADALNVISHLSHSSLFLKPPAPRLLTPHPGEMERLAPRAGRDRRTWAREFVESFPVTLLLKGARTIIAENGRSVVFNSTGHPGMATGGMGDVLTGVCAALLAQGIAPRESAILGAWLCGHAAEIAILKGASQESLTAHDVATALGASFNDVRTEHVF